MSLVKAAVFRAPGCKPANPVRTEVRTFCVPSIPPAPALAWRSAHWLAQQGANRKPCKPCFLIGRWRNGALAPPALDFGVEGPLLPGAYVRSVTSTIGSDRHHRHNHHSRWPAVTVVMVVMVLLLCSAQNTHTSPSQWIVTGMAGNILVCPIQIQDVRRRAFSDELLSAIQSVRSIDRCSPSRTVRGAGRDCRACAPFAA